MKRWVSFYPGRVAAAQQHQGAGGLVTLLHLALLGTVALLLRTLDLGGFLTVDETTTWVPNSYRFLRVLQSGDYGATPFMGYPAITTMWLGSAGVALRRALFEWGVLHTDTYEVLLAFNRLPTALVHSACVLAGYGLLRRIVPPATAALAALLWATDPFILAFSRVLHMDVLMGGFATLSLLSACAYWCHAARPRWLVLSALCAGLAVLSKLPALGLFPMLALIAAAQWWRGRRGGAREEERGKEGAPTNQPVPRSLLSLLLPLLLWGFITAATVVALWPTFWTSPARAYEALRYGVEIEGSNPHMNGNYFLGRPVDVPGPFFYPTALAMRTTPITLAGLLLLAWARWPLRRPSEQEQQCPGHPEITMLAAWIIMFLLAMNMFPLKFNRYLVPIFPAVDILAAVGLVWGAQRLAAHTAHLMRRALPHAANLLLVLVALAALLNAAWYHPYSIVYFNQLLGGARAGAYAFLAGWGEGLDQVAAWLNQQPDIASVVTVSRLDTSLNPYLKEGAYSERASSGRLPEKSGYLVVYYRHVQWGQEPPPYDDYYGHAIPLHIVTLHGVDYAWIYQVPRSMPRELRVSFGGSLQTHGYDIDTSAIRSSGVLTLTMQWHPTVPISDDYHLFAHVFDSSGTRVGQVDVPLTDPHAVGNASPAPTSVWQPGRYIYWVHPIPMPADLPPGSYRVAVGLYHPDDMSRVALEGYTPPRGAPDDGGNVVFLGPVRVP